MVTNYHFWDIADTDTENCSAVRTVYEKYVNENIILISIIKLQLYSKPIFFMF